MEAGEGEPLIMVPASISELKDWASLVQFMAQWFKVYFFELPGHGQSESFREKFSSHQVAELVEQLANALRHDTFSLMGFSFGGILVMRAFQLLSTRIERMFFLSPCLDHRAIPYSALRLKLMYLSNRLLSRPTIQAQFAKLIRNPKTVSIMVWGLKKLGRLEDTLPLKTKFLQISPSTVAVLNAQVNEILTTEFEVKPVKHETPCFFTMSVYDPLLSFQTTHQILQNHFANVNTVKLTYPFHQPPAQFTFDELNRDFFEAFQLFMHSEQQVELSP
jgi:pimeloyl-ACP methyl ester carboxylesterase